MDKPQRYAFSRIDWPVTSFLVLTPLVGIAGTWFLAANDAILWSTVIWAVVMLYLSGMSITAGYHRLSAHRAYNAHWLVRLMYALFGAAAFQGSILQWASDHREHHSHVDEEGDPYSIKDGFWHAHVLWLIFERDLDPTFKNCPDLKKDKIIMWQHNNYLLVAGFMCFIFPALIAGLWGDMLGGFIIAGVLRVFINHHFTFFINSLCHTIGRQTYSDRHSARDHWFTALFTYGEGYHNFHHEFAADYRNGIRFFHFDPTKWLIKGLSFFGLAWDLRKINPQLILERKLEMDRKRYVKSLVRPGLAASLVQDGEAALAAAMSRVAAAGERFHELTKRYHEIKDKRIESLKEQVVELKSRMNEARAEFENELKVWTEMPRKLQVLTNFKQ
jgi:stearoyl-CoA desaturase (delta-9 desaturase)